MAADKFPPWFPFYARDWRLDEGVRLLSLRQKGVYLELLIHQWLEGSIPEDEVAIYALIGWNDYQDDQVEDKGCAMQVVDQFFQNVPGSPGRLQNKRLEQIRAKQREEIEKKRLRATAGGVARAKQCSSTAQAQLKHSSSYPTPTLTLTSTLKEEEKKKRGAGAPVSPSLWMSWWNNLAAEQGDLTSIERMSPARKRHLKARIRESGMDEQSLMAKLSEELRNRNSWYRERGSPSFDTLLRPSKFAGYLEGSLRPGPGEKQSKPKPKDPERAAALQCLLKMAGDGGWGWEGFEVDHVGLRKGNEIFTYVDMPKVKLCVIRDQAERREQAKEDMADEGMRAVGETVDAFKSGRSGK
jgi:uncharacterized protein YdaU (DUF1376 family)